MGLDGFTQLWMGGVIVFGVVFYLFAMRYAHHCESDNQQQ